MIKVAALTSGKNVPSTRFRIRQHIQPLQELGIEVNEFVPAIDKYAPIPGWPNHLSQKYILPVYGVWQGIKLATRIPGIMGSWQSDITWLGRELLPGYLTLEKALGRPLILDVDDAIWLSRPFGLSAVTAIAKCAEVVMAGNEYLANWFATYAREVRVVPTAVDTVRYQPKPLSLTGDKPFVIGWLGTRSNLCYLEAIETPLSQIIKENKDVEILVMADKPPSFKQISADKINYIPWSIEKEVQAIQSMDVGIMPLPDTEWTKGKCSFKMLQYMACGMPVVVSPVGMNAEVLSMGSVGLPATNDAEWYEALKHFYINRTIGQQFGQNGRKIIEEHFSREVVTKRLAGIIMELA